MLGTQLGHQLPPVRRTAEGVAGGLPLTVVRSTGEVQ
jgi:hypothetical protein